MDIDDTDEIGRVNGWTFDPSREVWYARTGPSTWTEVHGALDDPPAFTPTRVLPHGWSPVRQRSNGWAPPRDRYVGPRSASVDERGATRPAPSGASATPPAAAAGDDDDEE